MSAFSPSSPKGEASGRNHGSDGYLNNTRVEIGKDADRHCARPTSKGKMKCANCHDYNRGVRSGVCVRCGYDRFSKVDSRKHGVDSAAVIEVERERLAFEKRSVQFKFISFTCCRGVVT